MRSKKHLLTFHSGRAFGVRNQFFGDFCMPSPGCLYTAIIHSIQTISEMFTLILQKCTQRQAYWFRSFTTCLLVFRFSTGTRLFISTANCAKLVYTFLWRADTTLPKLLPTSFISDFIFFVSTRLHIGAYYLARCLYFVQCSSVLDRTLSGQMKCVRFSKRLGRHLSGNIQGETRIFHLFGSTPWIVTLVDGSRPEKLAYLTYGIQYMSETLSLK